MRLFTKGYFIYFHQEPNKFKVFFYMNRVDEWFLVMNFYIIYFYNFELLYISNAGQQSTASTALFLAWYYIYQIWQLYSEHMIYYMIYIERTKTLLPTYTQNCILELAVSPSSLQDPLAVNKSAGQGFGWASVRYRY